ncbi:MAG TPA: ABC transporter permease subunit [Kiloniellales bacterium]|nr:ABC transporter permease subunit [Kiloniellales bacterium]
MTTVAAAMVRTRRLPAAGPLLLLAPALLFLTLAYLYPLGWLAQISVDGTSLSLEHYRKFFGTPSYLRVTWHTLQVSAAVTLVTLLLAYPTAYLIAQSRGRKARLMLLLVLVPYLTSFLVRSYAWIVLLNRQGLVNQALIDLGLIERPLDLLYNGFSVHVGMVHVMLPLMALPLYSVMRRIDPRLVRAAATLGAPPLRAHFRVFLPASLPGVASGCLLVFLLCLGFFITPALLGGLKDTMLAAFIEARMSQLLDWGGASAAAFVLLGVTLLGFFLAGRFFGFGAILMPGLAENRGEAPRLSWLRALRRLPPFSWAAKLTARLRARRWRRGSAHLWTRSLGRWTLRLFVGLVMLYLAAPIAIVVLVSFNEATHLSFPPEALSLRWYRRYLEDPQWLEATWLSLEVAALTAAFATAIGTLAAYALSRHRLPGRSALLALLLSPLVVPAIVLAVAMYGQQTRWGLIGTTGGLVMAHSVAAVSYVVIIASAAFATLDRRLEQAAASLGATPWRGFLRVVLPLVKPGIASAAIFAFIHSFDEVVITLFVAGVQRRTLPLKMWEFIHHELDPTIAAVSSLLILLALLPLLVGRGRAAM